MTLVIYLLKVSLSLMILYVIYRLLFSKLTFFRFNRYYIIAVFLGSFLIPFIKLPVRSVGSGILDYSMGIDWDQLLDLREVISTPSSAASDQGALSVFVFLYVSVVALKLVFGLFQFSKIRSVYADGQKMRRRGIRWNIHPEVRSPFTMFRTIYLDTHTWKQEDSAIIKHEEVHARQLHSVDLLISEIICAFLWFNPFVFLFKRQMRDNHEYLADQSALPGTEGLIPYMQALSSEVSRKYDPVYASCFQSSTIKKRIIMLTNKRSSSKKRFAYLAVLPVIALLTLAFQQPVNLPSDLNSMNIEQAQVVPVPVVNGPVIPSRFPMDSKYKEGITWKYGKEAKNPVTGKLQTHKGIDIKAPKGTPIYATADGVAAKVTTHEAYGKVVVLKHEDGYASLYAHMDSFLVKSGDEVKKGDQIGTVGNTGHSTGPHLHYEVMKNGENVNPADFY